MAAVAAARWDIEWERGGSWRARLVRRTLDTGVLIGIGAPCVMELRGIDEPSTTPAALTLTADVAEDHTYADLAVTRDQILALSLDRYQHRLIVTDLDSGEPDVKARGIISINDQVGD